MNPDLSQIKSKTIECGFRYFGVANAIVPERDKGKYSFLGRTGISWRMSWYARNQDLWLNLNNLGFTRAR